MKKCGICGKLLGIGVVVHRECLENRKAEFNKINNIEQSQVAVLLAENAELKKRLENAVELLIDRISLPYLIPLIKIKDNNSGEERYFGRDNHDMLVVQDNQISYYNLQCGDGTVYKNEVSEGEGFTFVCEPESYMNSVETISLKEYLKELNK